MTAPLQSLLDQFSARLDLVESTLGISGEAPPAGGSTSSGPVDDPPSIRAFDSFSKPHLDNFSAACDKIGGAEMAKCKEIFLRGWAAQRTFLLTASQCKKPDDKTKAELMKPVADIMREAQQAVQRDAFENHFKTVQESLGALNWLMIEPSPRDWIEAQIGSADYSGNKIRIQYKRNTDKFDENQHLFVDSLKKLLTELMPYTKEHHLTGVTWNPRGGDAKSFAPPAASSAPEQKPTANKAAAVETDDGVGIADLKNALGGFSTSGLKKVTKDMQTWRSEYKGDGPAPAAAPKKAPVPKRPVVNKIKGDKQVAFQKRGMRWAVEAQSAEDGVVSVEVEDVKHSVNIYGCYEATIDVKGKVKGINIDSCEKVKVLLDTAISSVEMVNCKRMQIQIRGKAPVVNIDKTDGCLTYLSAESLETQFTTAKSSEMNVSYPDKNGDWKETPIPEQFVHNLMIDGEGNGKMSAEVSELYS